MSKGTALKRKVDEKSPEISVSQSEFVLSSPKTKTVQMIKDFSFLIVFASLTIGFKVMSIGCS